MSENDYRGPSEETLRQLAGALPSFTEGILKKKTIGKGMRIKPQPLMPSKHCAICTRLFEFISSFEGEIKKGICPDCQKMINSGHIAIIADDNSNPKHPARKFMFIDRKHLKVPNIQTFGFRVPISEFIQIQENAKQREKPASEAPSSDDTPAVS